MGPPGLLDIAELLPASVKADTGELDLAGMLQLVADTIVESLGFEVAVVNIVVDDVAMLVAAVSGPQEVRTALLNRRQGLDGWHKLVQASEPWGALRFLDHRTSQADPEDIFTWVPDLPVSDDPDAWHPEDSLFAPLTSSDGKLLGMLSVDMPRDGRRPGPATRRALEAFTVTAALALEHASLAARSLELQRQFEAVFDTSPISIALLDEQSRFVRVNEAFGALLRRCPEDLLGHHPTEFTHPEDRDAASGAMATTRAYPDRRSELPPVEKRYQLPDGSSVWGRLHLAALTTASKQTLVIAQVEDITESKRAEAQLVKQAHYDSLTGLPNRSESMRRLREAILADSADALMTAVFFCDVDRLKLVNDTHGHAVGDAFIRAVSQRIRASVREQDIVGRLSGDEFVVVVQGIETPTEAIGLAGRIVDRVREPLSLAGQRFTPSLSLGIAYSGGGMASADELLAHADSAMYRAKVEERGAWHVFDPSMRNSAPSQLALRNDLAEALAQEQFVLHYQPVVRLATREVIGHEAVLRWQHPRRGLLAPSEFLNVVLDSEYEGAITDWVIRQACNDASRLPPGCRKVSVNVSSVQIGRRDLRYVLSRCLAESRLSPRELVLELTEDRLLSRPDGAEILSALHDLGVSLAIDDFGTGYAGLNYLQRFPMINTVKLDRSFIDNLGHDPLSENIVRAVAGLALSSGLTLVTEGVETEEQAERLTAIGVEFAQGYLFARPRPADQLLT